MESPAPLENAIPILTNYADYKKAREINAKIVNLCKEMEKHLAAVSLRLTGEGDSVAIGAAIMPLQALFLA